MSARNFPAKLSHEWDPAGALEEDGLHPVAAPKTGRAEMDARLRQVTLPSR